MKPRKYLRTMKEVKPRKYRRGTRIDSLCVLIKEIENEQYLWLRDRPIHPSFLLSMTLLFTLKMLTHGGLYHAVNNWLPATCNNQNERY